MNTKKTRKNQKMNGKEILCKWLNNKIEIINIKDTYLYQNIWQEFFTAISDLEELYKKGKLKIKFVNKSKKTRNKK